MSARRSTTGRGWSAALVSGIVLSGGCAATNALLDGVYVGISDTVARVVSGLLLAALGVE